MDPLHKGHQAYQATWTPATYVVRTKEDVEQIQVSFNQIRVSERVLTLPEQYWHYRHTDKLVNTQLVTDPFVPQGLIVIPLSFTDSSSTITPPAPGLSSKQKRALYYAKNASRLSASGASASAGKSHPHLAPVGNNVTSTAPALGRSRLERRALFWAEKVSQFSSAPARKARAGSQPPCQLQEPLSISEKPRSVTAAAENPRRVSSACLVPHQAEQATSPATHKQDSKLPDCDGGSCSSSDALSEYEDFYPGFWKKAGKADRKRKRHAQKRQQFIRDPVPTTSAVPSSRSLLV